MASSTSVVSLIFLKMSSLSLAGFFPVSNTGVSFSSYKHTKKNPFVLHSYAAPKSHWKIGLQHITFGDTPFLSIIWFALLFKAIVYILEWHENIYYFNYQIQ